MIGRSPEAGAGSPMTPEAHRHDGRSALQICTLLVDDKQLSHADFVYSNLLVPAANHMFAEPYSALRTVVNKPLEWTIGWAPAPKISPFRGTAAQAFSPSWLVQSAIGGAGYVCVLSGAQQLTQVTLRLAGFTAAGKISSLIIGGCLYEFLREPRENETRVENLVSGAAMLLTAETGNYFTSALRGNRAHVSRFITGTAAGASHCLTRQVLRPELQPPDISFLLAGGFLNMALGSFRDRTYPADPRLQAKQSTARDILSSSSRQSVTPELVPPTPATLTLGQSTLEFKSLIFGRDRPKPYASFDEYLIEGQGFICPRMRTHEVNGLESLKLSLSQAEPSYNRISAHDLLECLKTVPDIRLFNRVVVSDLPHRMDPWYRQLTGDPKVRIHGEIEPTGEMYLYRPTAGRSLFDTVYHEWAHLLEKLSPELAERFRRTLGKEPLNVGSKSGTAHSSERSEAWSILSEDLLSLDLPSARLTAFLNPQKASIWEQALSPRLVDLPAHLRSPRHAEFLDLCQFIRKLPAAGKNSIVGPG